MLFRLSTCQGKFLYYSTLAFHVLIFLESYGFAYAGEDSVAKWQGLVQEYLSVRKTLKRVCLLIDSRHGLKAKDLEAIDLFER
jgi:GTP-binding protein EngB required for normal cell division